jgi:hypothetical protein
MSSNRLAAVITLAGCLLLGLACAGTPSEPDGAATDESELLGLGENPQSWRSFWYAKHARDLDVAIEPATQRRAFGGPHTVLLVPGTTVGPEFFGPMAARLRRDGFDVVVWAPPDLFTDSLWLGAARLGDQVQKVLSERGQTRLHIVAECDGGVAARYYTQILGGNRYVDELVTFVSAHHGSQNAPVGNWFTHWPALGDIRPWSDVVTKTNAAPPAPGTKVTSIYTCHDEFLWPYTTSRIEGATNVEFCGMRIGHFDGFWNATVYDRILVALRGEGDAAPTWY